MQETTLHLWGRVSALTFSLFFLFFLPQDAKAQTNLPKYDMKFQFRDGSGLLKDTMMSRIKYKFWSKSSSYPGYVKWKNQPFAVLQSSVEGVGLFSDSTHSFSTGDTIGYAFFKIGSTGSFDIDFMESNIGSFINDSQTPNMEVLLTPKGLLLRAKQSIASTTELMASYREIIDLFPNDKSIRRSIQYW